MTGATFNKLFFWVKLSTFLGEIFQPHHRVEFSTLPGRWNIPRLGMTGATFNKLFFWVKLSTFLGEIFQPHHRVEFSTLPGRWNIPRLGWKYWTTILSGIFHNFP
jgi:hypothetical protein